MKRFDFYFLSPEQGGTWLESTVYAKTLKQAKRMIANLYYIEERKVFVK